MTDYLNVLVGSSHEWDYKSVLDLGPTRDNNSLGFSQKFTVGTGRYQATRNWHDQRSIAPSSNDDLDLTNLSLAIFGTNLPVVVSGLKALLVVNLSTIETAVLRIGNYGAGGFAKPWNDVLTAYNDIPGGGFYHQVGPPTAGWTVVTSVNAMLRLRNTATSTITYDISILGI